MEFGFRPGPLTVLLPVGAKFDARAQSSEPWPGGFSIDLYFEGDGAPVTWSATIDGATVTWSKTVANVAAILASDLRTVSLRGTASGGEPVIWRRGAVEAV